MDLLRVSVALGVAVFFAVILDAGVFFGALKAGVFLATLDAFQFSEKRNIMNFRILTISYFTIVL